VAECDTINVSRGSDWSVTLEFKDEADVPIDYTGASLSADMISNVDDAVILSPTPIWTDESLGQATLTLSELETPNVPEGTLSRLRITTVTSGGTTKIWPTALVEGA